MGGNLFLEHDGAFPLYHTFGLGRSTLPIMRLDSEWPEDISGDATLSENGDSLRDVCVHTIAEPRPPQEKGVPVINVPSRQSSSGDILKAVPTKEVLGHVQPQFARPADVLDVWQVVWRAQLYLEDLQK